MGLSGPFEAVPAAMKAMARWVCWRYEDRDGKQTKVPYDPKSGRRASTTDPATWCDYGTALAGQSAFSGIGIVLGDGLAGVDLDNCIDESGQLKPWAAEIVRRLNSYTEISPSGRGAKVFLFATLDGTGNRKAIEDGQVEIYSASRYFTVTGKRLEGSPLDVNERPAELEALHAELFPPISPATPRPGNYLDDEELLRRMFTAANGEAVRRLWEGNTSSYPSHSEADAALCCHLAFWTGGDRERIDGLFRKSGLCRAKWLNRPDYRESTISVALEGPDSYLNNGSASANVDLSSIIDQLAAASETADVQSADPGPMPEHLLHVPGFIDHVMAYTLQTAPYPEPVLAFCGALSLQSFLAGRKVRDPGDNRTNLYILGLANTGAGKDHPRKVNQNILLKVGLQDALGDAFASAEGIEDHLFRQPSVLFQTDEIDAVMIAIREGKEIRYETIMQMLLKMYSSSNGIYPMRIKAEREHRVIDQPSLVLFGTAIPKNYYEALSAKMLTNGFFARMLIIEVGRRGEGQEPLVRDLPPGLIETARWWVNFRPGSGNLEDWHPAPKVVDLSPEAASILVELRQEADREYSQAEARDDGVGMAIWARANEKARRLALIYACSENHEGPVINEAAARWASELVLYLTRRMLFMAQAHVSDNAFHAECLKLLEKLRNAPGGHLPHSVLLKRMKMKTKDFGELMDTLLQSGDVIEVNRTTAGRTGTLYQLVEHRVNEGGER